MSLFDSPPTGILSIRSAKLDSIGILSDLKKLFKNAFAFSRNYMNLNNNYLRLANILLSLSDVMSEF